MTELLNANQPARFLVVYYPSKEAFIEMPTSEAYAAIGHHRHLSLEYGGLMATETLSDGLIVNIM